MIPFFIKAQTAKISVTDTASLSLEIPTNDYSTVRIINDGDSLVFISAGAGPQEAILPSEGSFSLRCTPIMAGEDIVLSIPRDITNEISAICNTGEVSTIYIQIGEGE